MMELGFLGFGYSAQHLAELLQHKQPDCQFWGTRRQFDDGAGQADIIRMFHYDTVAPSLELLRVAKSTTHLLISIPPIGKNGALTKNLEPLFEKMPNLEWLGYCSTTGVYGDHQGAWVNEKTPPKPSSDRSKNRLAEEQALLALPCPVQVFRLSGIYGAGRNAFTRLESGRARCIDKPNQVFSRIHVEDIAQVLYASMKRPSVGSIYNLADDDPCAGHEPICYAAQLLGVTPPVMELYDPAKLSPMAREFYADSRRVSNDKIKNELGVTLRYPSYKQGLQAIYDTHYC